MRLRVIVNPRAGAGRAARLPQAIESSFGEHGLQAEVVLTRAPGEARVLAQQAAEDGVDGIIACGGDGSLFEVVNGLADRPSAQRPPLGVVPLGTGNAFARDLGLEPRSWREAIGVIGQGHSRRVDLARVRCEDAQFHFVNIAGCGFVVSAGRAAQKCKWLGPVAYRAGVLLALLRMRPLPLQVTFDGETRELSACFAAVANSRYTGTDFLIAPDARVDDGLLDLLLVDAVTRRRLLAVLPGVAEGRHVQEPEITCIRARRIELRSPPGLELAPDGEFMGRLPAVIECVPGALRVFTPVGELSAFGEEGRARREASETAL